MGLEEHLLQMFRDDFEFHGDAAASHLPVSTPPAAPLVAPPVALSVALSAATPVADPEAAPSTAAQPVAAVRAAIDTADSAPVATLAAGAASAPAAAGATVPGALASDGTPPSGATGWTVEGEKELQKIPFFVRGKARRNTERYAQEHGVTRITVETLYEAKAHFGR
jgi:light-independent protochlorophyllide reductase subunit B